MRRIGWFSCGAASAIACHYMLSLPSNHETVIAYCDTGSEDWDNHRFMGECEHKLFGGRVEVLRNEEYRNTWEVWERRKYLAGVHGAPCTLELKVKPRLVFQKPEDVHFFGYTADKSDVNRAEAMREEYPELIMRFPLIETGLTKANCLAMLQTEGIEPPRVYAMGLPNANCIPCVKATSPAYWALIRKEFPDQFERLANMSREMGVRLSRIKNERVFIDEIPADHPTTDPVAPECDLLCQLVEKDLADMKEGI